MISQKIKILTISMISSMLTMSSVLAIESNDLYLLSNEYCKYVNGFKVDWSHTEEVGTLFFEGSDVPAAKMRLFDNGILVLESNFSSDDLWTMENLFYRYTIIEDTITLISIDLRDDYQLWLETESYHLENNPPNVISVDWEEKSVTYQFTTYLVYSGFYFYAD